MKRLSLLALLLVFLSSISCTKDGNMSSPLYGVWEYVTFDIETEVTTFKKVNDLPENNGAIAFGQNGYFVQRANAGFCGTPPITYANYQGMWTTSSNATLDIEVESWCKTNRQQKMEIVDLSAEILEIIIRFD